MSHNLSVGFSDKAMIFLAQIVFELQVVFDDAVMHDHHAAGAVTMRVCVFFGGAAVRGPTRVAHPISAVEGVFAQSYFEIS